jgi:hypothetical protein
VKAVTSGSNSSNRDGDMHVINGKHGVFPVLRSRLKRKNENKDADITIWYTSTENHHM